MEGIMSNYPYTIKTRVTEEQYQKVKNSKMSDAEFIRCAIDSYDESVISLKLKIFHECKELWYKIASSVEQNIVEQNEAICGTIQNLENEKENLEVFEEEFSSDYDDFEERIKPIIPTLQRLKHGENGLTNSNIEFQAKKVGVDTHKLKQWINNNPDIMSKVTFSEERFQCNDDGKRHVY